MVLNLIMAVILVAVKIAFRCVACRAGGTLEGEAVIAVVLAVGPSV